MPKIDEGGTTPSIPNLDPHAITVKRLDPQHVLITGQPKSASGEHLAAVVVPVDFQPLPQLADARKYPLHHDGSFQFVADAHVASNLHLWAVAPDGTSITINMPVAGADGNHPN